MSPTSPSDPTPERSVDDLPAEEPIVEDEGGVAHPDPVTRREGMEQELIEEGRSDEGASVGQHNE